MRRVLQAFVPVVLALGGLASCGTDTKTVAEIPACSQSYPTGACDAGLTCFEGACVYPTVLCSPTNLTGECATGTTCFNGGCIPPAGLCSATTPTGVCEFGKTCVSGTCVLSASLCSSTNTSGTCPTGETCQAGACAQPQVDPCTVNVYTTQPVIQVDAASGKTIITVDSLQFKDLSGDGALQLYEDWRKSDICRARDLVSRMSQAQKFAIMNEANNIGNGTADGSIPAAVQSVITDGFVRMALIRLGAVSAPQLAVYVNNIQKLCEAQPLGVPMVITTDPSHGMSMSTSASGAQALGAQANQMLSVWPNAIGMSAINDLDVTRQLGDTIRREFRAIGLRWELGPQVDVSTEPRWPRLLDTFGPDAWSSAAQTKTQVEAMQGVGNGGLRNGVAATLKHFVGYGAELDGMDAHGAAGKQVVYPGHNFEYQKIPFAAGITAGAAAIMPMYAMLPSDIAPETCGAGFSKTVITGMLKEELGFDGLVTGDWGITGMMSYGIEGLSRAQKGAMYMNAGSHQFGGSDGNSAFTAAFAAGLITQDQVDNAVAKALELSFKVGAFENPYQDPAAPDAGTDANRIAGFNAQKKAIVILRNQDHVYPNCYGLMCYLTGDPTTSSPKYLPIDPTRTVDDTDGNGKISVYFDGVVDGLSGSDKLDPILDPYDYTVAAAGSAMAIEAAASAAVADIAVLRLGGRGAGIPIYMNYSVPLSLDAPIAGPANQDLTAGGATKEAHQVIDLLRIRDGYTDSTGALHPAVNPTLKIVLVVYMGRSVIMQPFVKGLVSLDETAGVPGSYPLVSNTANTSPAGVSGVDALLVDFGAYDRALLDVLFNKNLPTTPTGYKYGGIMPFEIENSDAAAAAQLEDLPNDSTLPTYHAGDGMKY